MDKKDIMYMVAALVIVLIIALVIKPIATGQPVNTGIPVPTTTQPVTDTPAQSPGAYIQSHMTTATSVPTTTRTPTPTPTWNPKAVESVDFVNPSNYGLTSNESLLTGTRINATSLDTNMTTFATIASSTGRSGTTEIMYIPFPYWELVYTVSPTGELKTATESVVAVTPTAGSEGISYSHSGVSGSYSTTSPQFTIQVMDGDDPNRIVRTITPPGGINLNLWTGVIEEVNPAVTTRPHQKTSDSSIKAVDPRPWTEKFFEGQRHYYFIITAQSLDSYSIKIQIPKRYIGKY
jgi:hypothetical protein